MGALIEYEHVDQIRIPENSVGLKICELLPNTHC